MDGKAGRILTLVLTVMAGCSRNHYRVATDKDVYGTLAEKSVSRPWQVPEGFNILPNPLSRFYDPTCLEDPLLPSPSPQLYAYRLPPLPSQMAASAANGGPGEFGSWGGLPREAVPHALNGDGVSPIVYLTPAEEAGLVRLAAETPPSRATVEEICRDDEFPELPIGTDDWEKIPRLSLLRMFEFGSVRREYRLTFRQEPPEELRDKSDRVTLEDIVYLASINSREYQSQKEALYRAALELTLERFRYALKFSTSNNGADVNYDHIRVDGVSESSLGFPASLQVDKVLITGGDFIARFANDVVLTFNGPQGFAADVTSDALFQFSQTLLQRDVRFEVLTQLERNVVYAVRDYARYRKELFVTLAEQYYSLIRNYRQIEIAAQNYFQLVRAFSESEAEYEAGQSSRIQVDQVEQQLLNGRRALVSITNSLENALDTFKIRIGLPTETRMNVDLKELEQLTRRDDLAVNSELVRRIRNDRLLKERQKDPSSVNPDVLLSAGELLLERMVYGHEVQRELGQEEVDVRPLRIRGSQLAIQLARRRVELARRELASEEGSTVVSEPRLLQATEALNQVLGRLICRQLYAASLLNVDAAALQSLQQQLEEWAYQEATMRTDLEGMLERKEIGRIGEFLGRARQSQAMAEAISQAAGRSIGSPEKPLTPEEELAVTLREVDVLLEESAVMLQNTEGGLVPVEIEVDDAMMTALVLRLDLMNERGSLADEWRRIKVAGDELRSVLNFNASQSLSTSRFLNQGVGDSTTDVSRTQVRMSFDAPLNRRAQRNVFRRQLINYQVALRGLMLAEDNIKFAVRQDLRNLSLDREQYLIEISSAALAYQRTVSTRLELRLPGSQVAQRDFLEAQSDYVAALSTVAERHINYILDRMQLFFDAELLVVDDRGFWNELYNEEYQPEPFYQLPLYAQPAYGELPNVLYSKAVKRMYQVPTGVATVVTPEGEAAGESAQPQGAAPAQEPSGPEPIQPPSLVPPGTP